MTWRELATKIQEHKAQEHKGIKGAGDRRENQKDAGYKIIDAGCSILEKSVIGAIHHPLLLLFSSLISVRSCHRDGTFYS